MNDNTPPFTEEQFRASVWEVLHRMTELARVEYHQEITDDAR